MTSRNVKHSAKHHIEAEIELDELAEIFIGHSELEQARRQLDKAALDDPLMPWLLATIIVLHARVKRVGQTSPEKEGFRIFTNVFAARHDLRPKDLRAGFQIALALDGSLAEPIRSLLDAAAVT